MVNSDAVVLTREMIDSAATRGCGFSKKQLEAVGVPWPPVKGWKRRLAGTMVTRSQYLTFSKSQPPAPSDDGVDAIRELAHQLALRVWTSGGYQRGSRPVDAIHRAKVATDAVLHALRELEFDMAEAETLYT